MIVLKGTIKVFFLKNKYKVLNKYLIFYIVLVSQLFKLMEKYRPETAAMKKRRLQVRRIFQIFLYFIELLIVG